MKTNKISIAILSFILVTGCNKHHDYIYSPDRKQCITIISSGKVRYIIDGRHFSIPDTNYVKLDVSKRFSLADNIVGCWEDGDYRWKIINDEAGVLENKLDTSKFYFSAIIPKDSVGIPSNKIFRNKKGFFYLGFDYGEIYDKYNVTIE